MTITHVGTYLGCDIYYRTPPDTPYEEGVYSSPCITGFFFKKSAVKKRICQGQGGTWTGSSCSFEDPDEDVPTNLSISAPSNVNAGSSFGISGVLQRADTSAGINNETVELWVDGVFRTSMLTTTGWTPSGPFEGAYIFVTSLSGGGVHALEVIFRGSSVSGVWMMASNAVMTLGNRLRALLQTLF